MSASDNRSVIGQNVANVPSLVVILEQLGWRVFNDQRRLSRLDLRIDEAKEKNLSTASLGTEKGKLQEQLERFDELLDDCAEWIRVRTGIPKRKIRDVAISTAFNEGKDRDDIYAKLAKLDEYGQTANLWTALVSQNRDALESVNLLPSIDSNPSALETGRQVGLADGGTSSPKAPTEKRNEVTGDDGGKGDDSLEKRLTALERQQEKPPKTRTKTERIRDQRIKFCCPKRRKKSPETWNEIYHAYNKKFPNDKTASPDTLLHSHDRNCLKCREQKS